MRIAVNTRFLLPHRMEGIGRFTWEVLHRMVEQHQAHEFFFLFDRPYDARYIPASNVHPMVLWPPARHPLLWYMWFEWAVPAALKRVNADVFFSPDGYCSLRADVPTVMVMHDLAHIHFPDAIPTMVRNYYDYYVPKYLHRAEELVAVSAFTANDIHAQYQIPRSKIQVACNGADSSFHPLTAEEKTAIRARYADGRPYFLYVAAMHPRKNAERLITAFDSFKASSGAPVKLLLAGRLAWQTGSFRKVLESARYRDDIHLLGYVSHEELPALTGAAFALTYVSLFEGFGIPLLEAMHCDIPILCADTSSIPEVAGKAGLWVNPHQVDSIANGMAQIWNDPDLRNGLVAEGRIQRLKFSWERAAHQVWESIEKSIQHKKHQSQ
jgi:glycosyltransferase involved in cell wall biosynthesis